MTLLVATALLTRELPTAFRFVLITNAKKQISAEMDHLSWSRPFQLPRHVKIRSQLVIKVVVEMFEVLKASACGFQQAFVTVSKIREIEISLCPAFLTIGRSILNISMQRKLFFGKISPRKITVNGRSKANYVTSIIWTWKSMVLSRVSREQALPWL